MTCIVARGCHETVFQLAIIALCLFVALALVQGLPTEIKDQKELRPQPLGSAPAGGAFKAEEEESQEVGDEEKDLSSSNTFGFGYYAYPRYYGSYYPSHYGGYYGGYRGYGHGYGRGHGYGGYYSNYRHYGWY